MLHPSAKARPQTNWLLLSPETNHFTIWRSGMDCAEFSLLAVCPGCIIRKFCQE